ncbi:ImmA/IrrE family metallo-endopeptidase [Fictibacillus sp. 23RED33]|uniref:ImmA/IrrE family metallo-endopeptidase n=1 Tax=Fictibacillus sp. 23RED33 TaxID=2745879 RepID=UPI0018CE869D|nr:ImmA/IrrE family metallo-endopeptidase [Fictibacillus sp. 23RED33]MBH0174749.1 ImmA/IrrE family metallo-endopeptidase [Fictibacillus sp. 23RED33]
MQLKHLMPKTKSDYWEERAEKVHSHFQFASADEIDILHICKRYGIKVLPLDVHFYEGDIEDGIKAFSIPSSKGRKGVIYIRPGLNVIEKKLILAEEFCHIYSHYQCQLTLDKHAIGKLEAQAKRMAAYLLMPRKFLEEVYLAAEEQTVLITDIADHFLVDEETVQYRLQLEFDRKVDVIGSVGGKVGTIEWI